MEIKTPIFIVGNPRSGTTLMRLVFNSHPEIAIPDETDILSFLFGKPLYKRIRPFRVGKESVLYNAIGENVAREFNQLPFYERLIPKQIIDFLFDSYARTYEKKYWGEKTPHHYRYIKEIKRMYPRASIIFMIRDPRAVAASSKRYAKSASDDPGFWAAEDIGTALELLGESARYALENKDLVTFVKYGDLVSAPRETLQRLCAGIGIDFYPGMIEYYKHSGENITAKVRGHIPDWHKETTRPVNTNNVEKWKKELTGGEVREIETRLDDYMRYFDYPKLS